MVAVEVAVTLLPAVIVIVPPAGLEFAVAAAVVAAT